MASTHKLASPNARVMGFLLVSASSLLGDLPIGFPIVRQLLVWAAMILLNVGTTFFFTASRSLDLSLLLFLFSFSRCQKSSGLGFFSLFLATRIVCQPKTVGEEKDDLDGHQGRLCHQTGHPLAPMGTPPSGQMSNAKGHSLGVTFLCPVQMVPKCIPQNTKSERWSADITRLNP